MSGSVQILLVYSLLAIYLSIKSSYFKITINNPNGYLVKKQIPVNSSYTKTYKNKFEIVVNLEVY